MTCSNVEGEFGYIQGAELGDAKIRWFEDDEVIDFSDPSWEFEAKIGKKGKAAVVTKTSGITGAATLPNVTIAWVADELDPLTPGRWTIKVRGRTTGQRDRIMQAPFVIEQAVQ